MNWLLDADVLSQPAKRHGDPRVIAWLEAEQDRCYSSSGMLAPAVSSREPAVR